MILRARIGIVMFTGIVEQTVEILGVEERGASRRIVLPYAFEEVRLGESIAVNGVCLTVAELTDAGIGFDVIPETLSRTNLGLLQPGDQVNIERSLRAGDRIDGHFVLGHVDGVGKLVKRIVEDDELRVKIEAPDSVADYLAPKGSICVDGVSLTIASIRGNRFDVVLIPTTLATTTLGKREPGWSFNLEADIIAKQIVHVLSRRRTRRRKATEKLPS